MAIDPYVSVEEIKDELGITDSARDAVLGRKVGAASRQVDAFCRRNRGAFALATEASTRVFDLAGRVVDNAVYLDDIGAVEDLTVESGTAAGFTVVTGFDTTVGNALAEGRAIESLYNPAGWTTSSGQQLRVTAWWGWPETPEDVIAATMIQAIRLFKRKDSAEGYVGSPEWGQVRMTRVDPDFRELLTPYVRMVLA